MKTKSAEKRKIGSIAYTPDGKRIAFSVAGADEEGNVRSGILLVSPKDRKIREMFSPSRGRFRRLLWSPDGATLLLLKEEERKLKLEAWSSAGEKRDWPPCRFRGEVHLQWSPYGRDILLAASPRPKRSAEAAETRVQSHLYRLRPEGSIKKLTGKTGLSVGSFDLSPGGSEICFSAAADGGSEGLYITDILGLTLRALGGGAGDYTLPRWAPDGERIACIVRRRGECRSSIAVYRRSGRRMLPALETAAADFRDFRWAPDGRHLYLLAGGKENAALLRYRTGSPIKILFRGKIGSFEVAPDGKHLAFAGAGAGSPEEIYLLPTDDGSLRRLTCINAAGSGPG